jgi:hypothetical protein
MIDMPILLSEDAEGCRRITACRPIFSGVSKVENVSSGPRKRLYHAGPPLKETSKIVEPLMNSLCMGVIYEGWATEYKTASESILRGDVEILAAQDHNLIVPLAGVLSPSMAVLEISNSNNPDQAYFAAINEGNEQATRLGKFDLSFFDHLKWLNGSFAEWLGRCAETPIELLPLIERSLVEGDDCHARTVAGSRLISEILCSRCHCDDKTKKFLDDSVAFALNFWMASAGLCLAQAAGINGCSIVTKVGSNGYEFGVQIAGRPGVWITENAPVPKGVVLPELSGHQPVGAIGDSTVVDFLGLGGQRLGYADATREALNLILPPDYLERPAKVLGSQFAAIGLENASTSSNSCCASKKGPLVLIGMIDSAGKSGRIGGGLIDVNPDIFCRCLNYLK